MPSLFLNNYAPLVATSAGRAASERLGLLPFIDGSIRREPDLEHPSPSISCLCRGGNFTPRLRPGDAVVYMTKKSRIGGGRSHWRLTAVLRVARLFEDHESAAEWFGAVGMPLPNNCWVKGNPPNHVSRSHRGNKHKGLPDDEWTQAWDRDYRARARVHRCFVVCERLWSDLSWQAPRVHGEDLVSVFGFEPAMRNPGRLDITNLRPLLQRVGVPVPPSCP